MSVMLYPCKLCVALIMCLYVLCVACLTVFVNCLVKQCTQAPTVYAHYEIFSQLINMENKLYL